MNVRQVSTMCLAAAVLVLGTGFGLGVALAAEPSRDDSKEGVEVLMRGPVHEAFAETVTFNPDPGILVPRGPPDAIEELPPDQRPAGDNVAWIPGYWGWDDERDDFLWVSGVWRALPPGRQWVSGYWGESGPGFQWTSGYWADAEASEVEYLSEPPETVEAGPNTDAPSADHSWLPGCWVWQDDRYDWRPGSWAAVQPNWVWVPAYYVWTPLGYVFVDGYWDYAIGRRGTLFAPVYFAADSYLRTGFFYSPAIVINLDVFATHLFLRPNYGHYYFGDYYDARYDDGGFYASYSFQSTRRGYDPLYAREQWQNRQDPDWENNVQAEFQYRRDNEDARPPRTWAAQRELTARDANSNQRSFAVAAPLEQLAKSKDSPLRFQTVDQAERQTLRARAQEVYQSRAERQQRETRVAATSADQPGVSTRARVKLPRSPIAARRADRLGENQAPPDQRPERVPAARSDPRRNPRLGKESDPRANQRPERDPRAGMSSDPRKTTNPAARSDPRRDPRLGKESDPKANQRPERDPRAGMRSDPRKNADPAARSDPRRDPRLGKESDPRANQRPERDPRAGMRSDPRKNADPAARFNPRRDPRLGKNSEPGANPRPERGARPGMRSDPRKDVHRAAKPQQPPKPNRNVHSGANSKARMTAPPVLKPTSGSNDKSADAPQRGPHATHRQ